MFDGGLRWYFGLWFCDIGGISNGWVVCLIVIDGGDYCFFRFGNRLWGMVSE